MIVIRSICAILSQVDCQTTEFKCKLSAFVTQFKLNNIPTHDVNHKITSFVPKLGYESQRNHRVFKWYVTKVHSKGSKQQKSCH